MTNIVTRIIISVIILINVILTLFGANPLPVDESAIFGIVSTILLVADHVYNTWKNFNVTPEAVTAQSVIDALKNGEDFVQSLETLIEAYKGDTTE